MLDIAKMATMNPSILKDFTVEEVLELHPIIDAFSLTFIKVQKTKPIKVKALSSILVDESVVSKVLLATLEGNQDLKANSFVCWGVDNDVWQQSAQSINSKYEPVSIDEQGWTLFKPRQNHPVDACQITEGIPVGPHGGFSVINPAWGDQRIIDGKVAYLHYGVVNDYVMRGSTPDDFYRISNKFFKSTYDFA